jgi:hypothetical protein
MVKRDMTISGNIVVAAILMALLSVPSCKSRHNLVIHQSDTLSVVLREMPVGYPAIQPFDHPYTIQPNKVFDVLASLHYDAASFLPFSRSQPGSVFTKVQAEQLASELSKALSTALPLEVTAFIIADAEKPDRRTKGLVFVLGDEFHLIIEELRKPSYQGEQKTYQQQVPRWELLPGDKQRHYTRHPGGKGTIANWIVTPLG